MLLSAIDINVEYRHLRNTLGYRGGGLPYSRLQLLSRIRSDLRITIQQGSLQHLIAAIDAGTPPAVFVSTGDLPYWKENVYHAVVVVGYVETEFYINDPAFDDAPQVVSFGDLDLAWLEYDSYFAIVQRASYA